MFYLLVECCTEFQRLIDATCSINRTIEVRELATKFTIDVIGSCAFGIQINALTDEECEFHRTVKKLSKPSYKAALWRMLRTAVPRLYKLLGIQVIDPSVIRFFKDVVSQMISQRENSYTKRHDFMDLLVELKNKGALDNDAGSMQIGSDEDTQVTKDIGKLSLRRKRFSVLLLLYNLLFIVLDENTIAAQAFVFFVAGYETSSNTIAFCLYELALNQDIQEKTRQEIYNAIEAQNGELTYDAVQKMKYLDMVILGMNLLMITLD
jgi:cytochrome P450 family 6